MNYNDQDFDQLDINAMDFLLETEDMMEEYDLTESEATEIMWLLFPEGFVY